MQFWGVEVKPGKPLKIKPDLNKLIHVSQAALGEVKNGKGAESVPLRLKIGDGNFVIGTLSAEHTPQMAFDLVFEKEFELSHDWKNGSVYLCGYTADNPYDDDEDDSEFSMDEDEDHPLNIAENGKLEPNVGEANPTKIKGTLAKPESSAKSKVKAVEPKKDEESDDDDEDADSGEDSDDLSAFGSSEGDESDEMDDDESDEEDEQTPKKTEMAKKRPSESEIKTPVAAKKAKSDTPQKTDGKKGGAHKTTPNPSKQAGKASSNIKSKEQTPKSIGTASCKACSKSFMSEKALESHSKAKHAGK